MTAPSTRQPSLPPTGRHRPHPPVRSLRHRRPPARRRGPPSPALLFVPPLVLLVGVVGVAALHNALGQPLGAAWAAEVWGLAKTALTAALAVTGFGAYVHRNNRRAWELTGGEDGAPPAAIPPPTGPHAISPAGPSSPPAPVRRRPTGKLTPVDGGAPLAPTADPPDRHAGRGGGLR